MSLLRPAWVAGGLLITLGLAVPAASAQDAGKLPTSKPVPAEPVARQVYAVRGGSAKDLASVLTAHFQAEPSFRAIPDVASNNLLLSGPKAALADALAVLREIDRSARTIRLEVLLVALASGDAKAREGVALSGPAREVKAKVRELLQKGVIARVKTVQLTALEGHVARSQVHENRPFVTGVVGFAGRGAGPDRGSVSRSITYKDVGTSVQVTPEVGMDGLVSLDLRVEDSQMRSAEGGVAVGTDDKGSAVPATEFVISTLETRLRVRPGQMVVAEGTKAESKSGQARTVILVTASIGEASPKSGK
jgi:type II secretory pathway component GspD/PulD (secretin)